MQLNGWSLRGLYRPPEPPGTNRLRDAHAALDSAVRAAYRMKEGQAGATIDTSQRPPPMPRQQRELIAAEREAIQPFQG